MSADERERVLRSVRALSDPPSAPGWNHAELEGLVEEKPRRAAAVLVALVPRREGLSVLLTRRHDDLSQHAGQVSFPGGGVDAGDADVISAALRETREEIGVEATLIEPFGYLDTLNPHEVAEAFEVPLAFLRDAANRRALRMNFRGRMRELYEYHYGGQRIWGATAAMLLNLIGRMEETT